MTLIVESLEKYEGREFSHFEDRYGSKLKDLYMLEGLVIVFKDGSKIILEQDWYGSECYFSQRKQA